MTVREVIGELLSLGEKYLDKELRIGAVADWYYTDKVEIRSASVVLRDELYPVLDILPADDKAEYKLSRLAELIDSDDEYGNL